MPAMPVVPARPAPVPAPAVAAPVAPAVGPAGPPRAPAPGLRNTPREADIDDGRKRPPESREGQRDRQLVR